MNTYLFDFDGTLVDSMPTFISVMLRILEEENIPYKEDIVKIITPLGYRGTAEYYKTLGISLSVEEMMEKMNAYAKREYLENIPIKRGVREFLLALKDRDACLNILTASPHTMLDPCLKRLGLYDLFSNVWSCDDFGLTKSDPKIYEQAAAKLGEKPQNIIFLDDNINALKTAKSAGMKVYGVYDASSEEYREEIKSFTEKYIEDYSSFIAQ